MAILSKAKKISMKSPPKFKHSFSEGKTVIQRCYMKNIFSIKIVIIFSLISSSVNTL